VRKPKRGGATQATRLLRTAPANVRSVFSSVCGSIPVPFLKFALRSWFCSDACFSLESLEKKKEERMKACLAARAEPPWFTTKARAACQRARARRKLAEKRGGLAAAVSCAACAARDEGRCARPSARDDCAGEPGREEKEVRRGDGTRSNELERSKVCLRGMDASTWAGKPLTPLAPPPGPPAPLTLLMLLLRLERALCIAGPARSAELAREWPRERPTRPE